MMTSCEKMGYPLNMFWDAIGPFELSGGGWGFHTESNFHDGRIAFLSGFMYGDKAFEICRSKYAALFLLI